MEALIDEMVSYVETNGGRVAWSDMVENMDGKKYPLIARAFYQAKSQGRLARQNTRTENGLVLEVFIPGK